MTGFVLDCSITMVWCFSDEKSRRAIQILDRLPEQVAHVPSLWELEVANTLLVAERKQRLTQADSLYFLELLFALPIERDQLPASFTFQNILPLAREHTLSSYDAAYLELAMRKNLPLATDDVSLKKAAARCGVKLI